MINYLAWIDTVLWMNIYLENNHPEIPNKMDGQEESTIQMKLIYKIVSVTFGNCGMTLIKRRVQGLVK